MFLFTTGNQPPGGPRTGLSKRMSAPNFLGKRAPESTVFPQSFSHPSTAQSFGPAQAGLLPTASFATLIPIILCTLCLVTHNPPS